MAYTPEQIRAAHDQRNQGKYVGVLVSDYQYLHEPYGLHLGTVIRQIQACQLFHPSLMLTLSPLINYMTRVQVQARNRVSDMNQLPIFPVEMMNFFIAKS